MAVEVLAPIAEAVVAFLAWIAEVFLLLLGSCIRSLRRLFSPSLREAERERLKGRGRVYRAASASWGAFAVLALVGLLAWFIYLLAQPEPSPTEACAKLELQQVMECAQAIREALPK